jgi:hypothetical protein
VEIAVPVSSTLGQTAVDCESRGAGWPAVAFHLTAVDACPAQFASAVKAVIMTNKSDPPDEGAEGRSASAQEQDAALRKLAAGEGDPIALAKVLRQRPELLDVYHGLPDSKLVRTVRGLAQLSHDILTDVETGGTPLDHAVFVGHYGKQQVFHGPERRAEFHKIAIGELKSLDGASTEKCGNLSHLLSAAPALPRRCQRCYELPLKQCEYRIVDEALNRVLKEQTDERRRLDSKRIWSEPFWSVWHAISWIAFRDVERLCDINSEQALIPVGRYASNYGPSLKEAKPESLLLAALRNDHLRAIRNSAELPDLYWADVDRYKVDRDVSFRRTDVCRCWPGSGEGLARQHENASYAQAQNVHERRKALDQLRDRLEQGAEIRAALEKAYSDQSKEAQAAPSPETLDPFEAVLELLSGRNARELADLSEAAAARFAELKGELTPERETALRLLVAGQGSAQAIIDALRSVPSLVDLVPLPYTPRIQAIRELIQIAEAGSAWDGFNDQYWTIGQMVLWATTGDRWAVDQASNDSGRRGELFGQDRAKVVFDALNVPRERIRQAADELWRQCLSGHVKALVRAPDLQWRPIPASDWLHLDILLRMENTPWVVRRGKAFTAPGHENILFPRPEAEKLRKFLPGGRSEHDVTALPPAAEAEQSAARPPDNEKRSRRIAQIEERLKAPDLRDRTHYRVTEIVDDRVPDSNPQRRAEYFRAFELGLKDGLFNDGKRELSQLFFMDAASGYLMRLTKDRLAMYLGEPSAKDPDAKDPNAIAARDAVVGVVWKMDAAKYRARRLESLARQTWMLRRFVGRWFTDYNLGPLPSWLEDAPAPGAEPRATLGEPPASSSSEGDNGGPRRSDEVPSDRVAEPDTPEPRPNSPAPPDKSRKRGKPRDYDWGEIDIFIRDLIKERGPLQEDHESADWRRPADIEREVHAYFESRVTKGVYPRAPSESTVRGYVAKTLKSLEEEADKGR